jgi:cytochrome c-type biogenesis protein CcmF
MDYIGEHLLPRDLGNFLVTLSLIASLVASFAYFKAVQVSGKNLNLDVAAWKKLARIAFITEAISVFTIFGLLVYITSHHLFEYKYAWQHSSRSLEPKYLLSCIWEGQEGSFLLWSIWHCVLGLIIIRRGKQWEAPVMTIMSLAQFCLATMIIGYYFFDKKLGSNPFVLLRNEMDAPIFSRADYLTIPSINSGNDLNPLLQNYWMVIHPPILFMGFASTIVPFSYAIAGLWTKKYGEWTRVALPWALFSAAVLGVGIMMGGAWAYESLNFGGYWAWDPVENASLVPWLTLIAGIHTLLIFNHTGRSLRATTIFFILAFSLVLYSTFLTRSGILGDTSVHAFTDLGMNLQLYLLLYLFVWISAIAAAATFQQRMYTLAAAVILGVAGAFIPVVSLLSILAAIFASAMFINKNIPSPKNEEETSSREFWMFIGSLIFFLTALFVIVATSLPVINKLFTEHYSMGEDVVFSYNRIIVFVAIIIGLLTAITQYFKYKSTPPTFFWKKIALPTAIAAVIAALVIAFGNINYNDKGSGFLAAIILALAFSVYAVVANAAYIWVGVKGRLSRSGGSIAHLGFGLMLAGILISSSKKEILSWNTSGIFVPLGQNSKEKPGENLTLIKGVPTKMGEYTVTYTGERKHPGKDLWYYDLEFAKNGKKEFTLTPNAFINYKGNQGLMANPDAKRYPDHDIFTYITSLPDPAKNKDTASFQPKQVQKGDTVFYSEGYMVLNNVVVNPSNDKYHFKETDTALMADITVYSKSGQSYSARPLYYIKNSRVNYVIDTVVVPNLQIGFTKVLDDKKIELQVKESNALMQYITLKAYKFPFINLLWLGTLIMALGALVSMVRRIRSNKASREVEKLKFQTTKKTDQVSI